MFLLTVATNIFALIGIYVIVRDTLIPFVKQIICKYFIQPIDSSSHICNNIEEDDKLEEYIEIDDYTKSWRLSTSGSQHITKPSAWSVSSLSSTSSISSLDIDFSLPLPLCPLTSTRNYSRKSSLWSLNSECYYTTYSTGSSSSSLSEFSLGSSDISNLKWSSSSTSHRPLLTSLSQGSFHLPSIDEDVFQEDTLGFKVGYYSLTTVNSRDMSSISSGLSDTEVSADSVISSSYTTPKSSVGNASKADLHTANYSCGKTPHFSFASETDYDEDIDSAIYSYGMTPEQSNEKDSGTGYSQFDVTPFPIAEVVDYEKPPGPSPYGMRRRRVFTFSSIVKD